MVDPGYSYDDWAEDFVDGTDCDVFDSYFMKYYRAFGYDEDAGKLAEFYVGKETVAGVSCMVFESKGLNAITEKYWIDPSNGCCLKYMSTETGEYREALEYNLNYTAWTDNLAPADYSVVE